MQKAREAEEEDLASLCLNGGTKFRVPLDAVGDVVEYNSRTLEYWTIFEPLWAFGAVVVVPLAVGFPCVFSSLRFDWKKFLGSLSFGRPYNYGENLLHRKAHVDGFGFCLWYLGSADEVADF
ncbi:unnamed protein product [Calypogeia fissa]